MHLLQLAVGKQALQRRQKQGACILVFSVSFLPIGKDDCYWKIIKNVHSPQGDAMYLFSSWIMKLWGRKVIHKYKSENKQMITLCSRKEKYKRHNLHASSQ